MPLMLDTRRHSGGTAAARSSASADAASASLEHFPHGSCIEIGLVNNMPDSALEATERQFTNLLSLAADSLPVRLRLFAQPEVPREAAARARIDQHYGDMNELRSAGLDALIVTGAEPRCADLRQEAYWNSLTALIDWSKENVASAVWSCLAAHAAVLYLDGVPRRPLPQKCCGVFEHALDTGHPLVADLSGPAPTPHSRWNEVTRDALLGSGYDVLAHSELAGVNLFAKRYGSLFVFWQGHPEYDDRSLLKEYQRDVGRFLRGERETYPNMPLGYFEAPIVEQFDAFRTRALAHRSADLLPSFPFEAAAARLVGTWRPPAVHCYRRWLHLIGESKSMRSLRRA